MDVLITIILLNLILQKEEMKKTNRGWTFICSNGSVSAK